MILSDYLQKNYRSMEDGEGYFTRGLGYPSPESFDRADIRILYIFLSSTDVRFMSGTYQTLYGLIDRDLGCRVFQDSYYFDFYYKGNVEKMVNDGVCPLFGNVSHRPFQDYDIIAVSLSVFGEVLNIPWLFKQAGIPLSFEERMNRKDIPLIVLGGAAASSAHILFGDVGNGKQSLVDCVFFGHVEEVWSKFVESYIGHSDKATFVRKFASSDSRLFVPADYVYDHEVTGGKLSIKNIRKLNPDLPDKISISQITKPESILTFHKKLFGAGITGAHSTDLVISSGCTGSGACSFCLEGNLIKPWVEAPLENIVEGMERVIKTGASKSVGFYSFNNNYHSQFPDILTAASGRFKRVSVVKQRADVVACSPGYMDFCREVRVRKVQLGVEGMGDRIRNQLYNKNLNRETLMKSVRETLKHTWIEMKLALIVSGMETQDGIRCIDKKLLK